MGEAGLLVAPGWWGWQELPVRFPGWGASPVLVERVEPLKSGKGILRIGFIHAMRPVAACRRSVDLRVIHRAASHLVGLHRGGDGVERTVILSVADYGWIESFSGPFLRRRPPRVPTLHIVGKPLPPGPTAGEYLDDALGHDAAQVLAGATAARFGATLPPMPARQARFAFDRAYDPFNSWMIARGFVAREMEEKWFIHGEDGQLLFRRSWTGNLIYAVEARWQGDRLRLGAVTVNRDQAQYTETDDDQDRRTLEWLITVVLLGERADYPAQSGTPAQVAIAAWAMAGKASL